MAIVQRPIPRLFPPLSARRRGSTARTRPSRSALAVHPVPVVGGIALACIFYLGGWAQVADANNEAVKLKEQIGALQARNHIIATELIGRRDKDAVETWAQQHDMVQAGSACVYVGDVQPGPGER